MKFTILDRDWAQDLERGFEEYICKCVDSLDSDEEFETESGIFYCGCDTCYNRETISYLTPRIIQGYLDGKVTIDGAV